MTSRQRRITLLFIIAAAILLAWATRGRWLPGLLAVLVVNADLIQVVESLVNIGGVIVPLVLALLGLLGLRRPPVQEQPSVLRPITLDDLHKPFDNWPVKWIDRGATGAAELTYTPHLVITGISKVGKSREGYELIRHALPYCSIDPGRIF